LKSFLLGSRPSERGTGSEGGSGAASVRIEAIRNFTHRSPDGVEEVIDGDGARPGREHGHRVEAVGVARRGDQHSLEDALHDVILLKPAPPDE
jgi:hypothetical protein